MKHKNVGSSRDDDRMGKSGDYRSEEIGRFKEARGSLSLNPYELGEPRIGIWINRRNGTIYMRG